MASAQKVIQEMKGKEHKDDILAVIKKHTMKFKPKEEAELLKPTLANLFGLEIRFKAHDE